MTLKQRYLFDITGYLHLKNVLTSEILRTAQEAVDRYITTPIDQMPDGFEFTGLYQNGFAFDKCWLAFAPGGFFDRGGPA